MKKIKHFNKRLGCFSELEVIEIEDNVYELVFSDPFDYRYNTGTIIKTRINSDGFYEIIDFRKSNRVTYRFFAALDQNLKDLEIFIEEFHKHGGKFQVDFGGIISVTVPKDFPYDIDKVIKEFAIKVTKI
ncbi:hypothetical protein GXP67_14935 [Rhodocytophaga rosea]|uniref:DUF4265 domain-containing protein n=1 Tax=Rhodocytophaga rosea TaxID=2704465 RepID=A0A6C0GJK7_9BACT|nr:hypothetical protein [Rhodocytophaga rosea]QHT67842.1 hypothetical protein GXP67_14935 [Rhodocytophaga rosea]